MPYAGTMIVLRRVLQSHSHGLRRNCFSRQAVYRQAKTHSQPPVSLLGQLYWREHFYLIAAVTPQYGTMHGNPMCRIIDWCDGAARACLGAKRKGGAPGLL